MEKLEWSALEYEEKERSSDWFWALGIIMVTGAIASLIYGNYFFATLLILSGALLGFFAQRKPEEVYYELNERGLKIRNQLYPYENIKSFWVQSGLEEQKPKPVLFLKTERFFMPVISVHINSAIAPHIRDLMLEKGIPEEPMEEHLSETIMEYLGF